jgi:chromosomal replication initiation ATPase DnaA
MNKKLFDKIIEQILNYYDISKYELYEQSKMPDVVNARYLLFYICELKGISISRTKKLLEDDGFIMTYATILRGAKAIKTRINENEEYKKVLETILKNIDAQ